MLSIEEYAFYTISNTMLGTMTVLADAGVSMGVLSQGGKVWDDRTRLGQVIVTGLSMRRKFAIWSLAIVVPVLIYLLHKHGASAMTSCLLTISLLPGFFAALSGGLLEIGPKLHQDLIAIQKISALSSILRLSATATVLMFLPLAGSAVLASGVGQFFTNWKLRQLALHYADLSQSENAAVKKEIGLVVYRVLPGAIYFCVSGQITIWILSIFGSTKSMAEIGALFRLLVLLAPISTIFAMIVTPRFARQKIAMSLLLRKYWGIQAILVALSGVILLSVWVGSPGILWVLGEKYYGLALELNLTAIGACLNFISACNYNLNAARGLIMRPAFLIPWNIACQAVFMSCFDCSSTLGVLYIWICVSLMQAVVQLIFFVIMCRLSSVTASEHERSYQSS